MTDIANLLPDLDIIARRAGEIAQQSRLAPRRELKPDGTIVTNGDKEVESYLRDSLTKLVPNTTVWGEEYGHSDPGSNGLWIVDPIDGTSNFSYGSPLWGVSIALAQERDVVLSAINLPDLGEMYMAAVGHGATCNGDPLATIPPGKIQDYELVSYNDHVLAAMGTRQLPGKMRLAGAVVIDGAFVARQRYRGLVGVREKLYDIAALVLILRELDADVRFGNGDPLVVADLLEDKKLGRPWIGFPKESGFFTRGD